MQVPPLKHFESLLAGVNSGEKEFTAPCWVHDYYCQKVGFVVKEVRGETTFVERDYAPGRWIQVY